MGRVTEHAKSHFLVLLEQVLDVAVTSSHPGLLGSAWKRHEYWKLLKHRLSTLNGGERFDADGHGGLAGLYELERHPRDALR